MDLSVLPWQAPAWQALRALRTRGGHAFLVQGAAGIGKFRLARAFAAAQLCASPAPDGTACGHCAECRLLLAGNHPDLLLVVPAEWAHLKRAAGDEGEPAADEDEAAGEGGGGDGGPARASREIRVDQVLEVAAGAAVTSHRGGVRTVVVYPAERLNPIAGNALLKTLEEPPGDTLFLLVTAAPDELLPTLRSRCLRVAVPAPAAAEAQRWLEAQGLAPDEAAARLAQVGGAPLWALEPPAALLDELTRAQLLALLRRGPRLAAGEIAAAVGKTVPVAAAIGLFQRWGIDLLAVRTAGRVLYHREDASTLARLAEPVAEYALLQWLDRLARARAAAEHPLNPRLVVEQALIGYRTAMGAAAAE